MPDEISFDLTTPPTDLAIVEWDTAPFSKSLAAFDNQVALLVKQASNIEIVDDKSLEEAINCVSLAKQAERDIETRRKQLVEEPYRFIKAIGNLAKRYQDPLNTHILERTSPLKLKIADYRERLKLEAQRAEALARESARKLQEELDREAKKQREEAEAKAREAAQALAELEKQGEADAAAKLLLEKTIEEETAAANAPPPVVAPVIPESVKVFRSSEGSVSQRLVWDFEVTDLALVERDFLVLDEKAVRAGVKAGLRESPGLRIFQRPVDVFR